MNSHREPIVTVIIATYNRAHILPRALTSLQNQTLKDWKAIIVDDGSTDTTREVVDRFAKIDDRFSFVALPHNGPDAARNAAHRLVTTPLLTYLDSDDAYKPNHLEMRVAYLYEHPEVDLIYGGLEIVGDPMVPDRFDPNVLVNVHDCVTVGTIVMKREVVEKLHGFDLIPYASDAEFVDRANAAFTVAQIDTSTYIYHREDSDSITHAVAQRTLQEL